MEDTVTMANRAESDPIRGFSSGPSRGARYSVSSPTRSATEALAASMPSGRPMDALPRSNSAMLRKHNAGSANVAAKAPSVAAELAGSKSYRLEP